MKRIIYLAFLLTGFVAVAAPAPSAINEKVLQAFKQTFTAAQNVTWHQFKEYTQANFEVEKMQVSPIRRGWKTVKNDTLL
jgi:hypothetical protein